jgi:hypothetical protein
MKNLVTKVLMLTFVAFLATACFESKGENAAEDVGESIQEVGEDVGESMEDAADNMEDAADDAVDNVEDEMDN